VQRGGRGLGTCTATRGFTPLGRSTQTALLGLCPDAIAQAAHKAVEWWMKQTGAQRGEPVAQHARVLLLSNLPSDLNRQTTPRRISEMTYQAFMRQAGEAHAQREERYKAKLSEVRKRHPNA
jgi:hypothetical protein